LAFVGLICLFINRNIDKQIEAEEQQIADLQNRIRQLDAIIKQVEEFKQKQKDLNQKIDTIKKLNEQRSGPVKLLEEFTYLVPRKAWIVSFKESNKQLSLEGKAVDGPTVADFIDSLRTSKYFQDVQLIQVSSEALAGKTVEKFTINCRVDYAPAGKSS